MSPLLHGAHHIATQAVKVVSMPSDPLEAQGLQVARDTYIYAKAAFWVGIAALMIGTIALAIALWDAFNNSTLLRIALARAKFAVDITAETLAGSAIVVANEKIIGVAFHYNLKNVGERATDHYELTVFFPLSVCRDRSPYAGERRTIDGIEHKAIRLTADKRLFPFSEGYGWKVGQLVPYGAKSVELRWKAYDDNGPSPSEGYGTVNVDITY